MWPGERVDFVIAADQKVNNYWIRYRGYDKCQPTGLKPGIYQVAVLRYNGANEEDPDEPIGYDIPKIKEDTRASFIVITNFLTFRRMLYSNSNSAAFNLLNFLTFCNLRVRKIFC